MIDEEERALLDSMGLENGATQHLKKNTAQHRKKSLKKNERKARRPVILQGIEKPTSFLHFLTSCRGNTNKGNCIL